MGKHDDIEFLRFALGLTKEEFDETTEPLNLYGLSVGNKLDAIATQSMVNKLKVKVREVSNRMGLVLIIIIAASCYMAGGH